ncbi:glycosyltransferase [Microbacterium phage Schubert]|uniref:Glycosyltransferase n=1 Tax=Microbacterium phage Schubert TaxID=2500787 RepID=A0A3T0IP16_9CAUD|nr:glycosyltransferase [Microbacterium phage Schubert]AZV01751.1 glycosyltransferase [Microbacterium phage Schubert]
MSNLHIPLLRSVKSSWMYPIYVPSYNRAGKAPLLEMLKDAPTSIKSRVHIVVRDTEANDYQTTYPWATIVKQRAPYGIGPARMVCLKDADRRGHKRIVMLDDDIIHVSLLERIQREDGMFHTRRYSAKVSGIAEPMLLVRSLAVGCKMAEQVFRLEPEASYGAARNALFSGGVDTSVGATLNKGSFPACVMFFHMRRFRMRRMPKPYQYHGEDLAMFLETISQGKRAFTLPGVAYDQHGSIETTIPLDPQDAVARTPDLEAAEHEYPKVFPFLRAAVKNKAGGIMRIGVNWKSWYKATSTEPVEIPLSDIINKAGEH